jgi:TetR/AcrR family transcriptional regulator, regulator of cefoperazone and chloramphenicol sensitivity
MSSSRQYSSTLRNEQASRTRLLIRQAARDLFGRQGFAPTTVAGIAKEAGVSAATVYAAYESKAGIVSAMLEELEESADIPSRLGALFAETDARRQLQMWVDAHCALFEGGTAILRAAMQAAQSPEVAAFAERGDGNRRRVIDVLVSGWEVAGSLRPGLAPGDAADQMYLLSSTDSYLSAIDRLGWPHDKYSAWLDGLLAREILRSEGTSTAEGPRS